MRLIWACVQGPAINDRLVEPSLPGGEALGEVACAGGKVLGCRSGPPGGVVAEAPSGKPAKAGRRCCCRASKRPMQATTPNHRLTPPATTVQHPKVGVPTMSNTIVRQLHDHDRSTMTATKILTIAAVPEFRTAVASILDGDGYATATAGTGAEGLRSATSVMPDVVIVDSRLPDMTLGELCLRLRSVTMARIVALTRPESNDERLVAMAAGVDRCLNKPFTTDQLLEIIEDGAPNATTDTMENPQQVGRLRIDRLGREVHWDDVELKLTRIEFDLLATLAARPRHGVQSGTAARACLANRVER
ncbi:Response regulator MprA [Nymphon striatum]|nr:Response regulator MprA [Nymphon striatum]